MYCVCARPSVGALLLWFALLQLATPSYSADTMRPTITAFVDAGGNYTSNRNLTQTDQQHEYLFSPEYGLRAGGTVFEQSNSKLTYAFTISINSARAERFPEDSGETANFEASLKYVHSEWTYALSYNPTLDYSQWFEDYSSTSHVIAASAKRTYDLPNDVRLTPVFGTSRRDHSNDFADRSRASFKAVLEKDIFNKKATISVTPSVSLDFYDQSPVPEERRDLSYAVSFGIDLPVNERMVWGLSVAYQERHSTVDGLDYNVMQVIPLLSADYQF